MSEEIIKSTASQKPASPPAAKGSLMTEENSTRSSEDQTLKMQTIFSQMEMMFTNFMLMKSQFQEFQQGVNLRMDKLEQESPKQPPKEEKEKFSTPPVYKDSTFPSYEMLEECGFDTIARVRQELPDPTFSEYVKDFDDETNQSEEAKEFRMVRKLIKFDDEMKRKDSKRSNPPMASSEDTDNITHKHNKPTKTKIKDYFDSKKKHYSKHDANDSDADIADYTKNTHQDINNMRKTMFSNKKKKKKSHYSDDEQSNSSNDESSSAADDYDKMTDSRRNSTLGRIIKTSSKHARKRKSDPINRGFLYMKSPPAFDGYLNALTPRKVFNFFHKILLYKTATGLELEIALYISDEIRELLMSLYKGLTLEKFYDMSDSKLLTILQMESRPKTHIAFYNKLKGYTSFVDLPKNYEPTPLTFKLFYDGYITYKNRFIQMYDLMAEDNEINIPPLKNKEGGLIKLFLDKIPFSYGQQAYKSIVRANDDKENFKDIKDFIHKLGVFVEEHYRKYEENKSIAEHFLKDSKKTFDKSSDNNSYNTNNNRFSSSHFQKNKGYNKSNNNNSHNYNNTHGKSASINHIQYQDDEQDTPDEESSNDEDPPETYNAAPNSDDSDTQPVEEERNTSSHNVDTEAEYTDVNNEEEIMQVKLAELMLVDDKNNNRTPTPVGCLQMLLHNQCKRGSKCTYAHDHSTLQRSHAYYTALLEKSEYKPSKKPYDNSSTYTTNRATSGSNNNNNRYPPKRNNSKLILTRPKPPPPARDSRSFYHITDIDNNNAVSQNDKVSDKR